MLDDFDVAIVSGGRQAIERLNDDAPFDVVLCDLMMPDMNGMDVYEAVKAEDPGLAERFIFITGGTFDERAQRFVEAIDNPFLRKPFGADAIIGAIRSRIRDLGGAARDAR